MVNAKLRHVSLILIVGFFARAAFADTPLAAQVSRYTDEEKKEEFFIYCAPPEKKEKTCGVSRTVQDTQVASAQVPQSDARLIVDHLLSDLPKTDVVTGTEPAALNYDENVAFLWQVKRGKKWSKGVMLFTDIRGPASKTGVNRTRLFALNGFQTRIIAALAKPVTPPAKPTPPPPSPSKR